MRDQSQWSYKEVDKSLAARVVELIRSLQIVRDTLGEINGGKQHHIIPLSGQLRALLTDRSRGADPLLLYISNAFGTPPDIYRMPDIAATHLPESLKASRLLSVSGFPLSLHRRYGKQIQTPFETFLDTKLVCLGGKDYTPREVIDWHANLTGGAHYSRRVPEDFAALSSFNLLGVDLLQDALIQIGQATLELGWSLLERIINFSIHLLIAAPQQKMCENVCILDCHYPNTLMRVRLVLNNRLMPIFSVIGIQGNGVRVESDRQIDWSNARYIHAGLSIESNLSTTAEMFVDDIRIGRVIVPEPVFAVPEMDEYNTYMNRTVEQTSQESSFGLGFMTVLKGALGPLGRAQEFLFLEQRRSDPDNLYLSFSAGSFGHAPPGTTTLTMTGEVKRQKAAEILCA